MADETEPETFCPQPPILKTARLILRETRPADAEALFKACQDPDINPLICAQSVPSPCLRRRAISSKVWRQCLAA
jgi:RimJ/RimL family protein N-acetyltransferase